MALSQTQEQQLLRLLARFSGEGSTDTKYNTLPTISVAAGAEVRPATDSWGSVSKDSEILLMQPDGTPRRITIETLINAFTNININQHPVPGVLTAVHNLVKGGQVQQYVSNHVQALNTTIAQKYDDTLQRITQANKYTDAKVNEVKQQCIQGWRDGIKMQLGSITPTVGTSRINLPRWVEQDCWIETYAFDKEIRGRIRHIKDGTNRYVVGFELHDTYPGYWMCIGKIV